MTKEAVNKKEAVIKVMPKKTIKEIVYNPDGTWNAGWTIEVSLKKMKKRVDNKK